MDPTDELALIRAEISRLRIDVNRTESLRRQLDAARDQLRRYEEAMERRDAIIRQARKQIAMLSRRLEDARRESLRAQKALSEARGIRRFAIRAALRGSKRRRWRWPLAAWRTLRKRDATPTLEGVEPTPVWEPPSSIPSRPRSPRSPASLRVAAIVGSGLRAQLDPECTLITFGPEEWRSVLEDAQPHLFVVESDPYANDGGWQGQLGGDVDLSGLRAVTEWCATREIPTAFWNTADPLELERWLPIAALHEHIFSVDRDAVARYAARGPLVMANIAALPEGVQPRIFGPGSAGRARRACFVLTEAHTADARLWAETQAMLAAVRDVGVDVYAPPGAAVPAALSSNVRELTEPLAALYRRYAVALSSPAHGDSKGKTPRRVLEMLASGAAVVARASPDVSLHLGSVVTTVVHERDAQAAVLDLLEDEEKRTRIATEGFFFVLRAHTSMHRLAAIASATGLVIDPEAERRVAALVLADHADDLERTVRLLADQSRSPDEIILGTKSRSSELEETAGGIFGARVRIVTQDGDARAQRLRELARMSSTPWVFIPNPLGDTDALESLVLRAPFVAADVVARATDEVAACRVTEDVTLTPAVARRELVAERGWPEDIETLHRWSREGTRIYAIEPALHR